mmetsp:Transcript_119419/g.323982  ORF Transcript_119419/g.323982 Transcript_119419/m.323982 type:complete len:415 (-) Transcript_119419:63-1307(-)
MPVQTATTATVKIHQGSLGTLAHRDRRERERSRRKEEEEEEEEEGRPWTRRASRALGRRGLVELPGLLVDRCALLDRREALDAELLPCPLDSHGPLADAVAVPLLRRVGLLLAHNLARLVHHQILLSELRPPLGVAPVEGDALRGLRAQGLPPLRHWHHRQLAQVIARTLADPSPAPSAQAQPQVRPPLRGREEDGVRSELLLVRQRGGGMRHQLRGVGGVQHGTPADHHPEPPQAAGRLLRRRVLRAFLALLFLFALLGASLGLLALGLVRLLCLGLLARGLVALLRVVTALVHVHLLVLGAARALGAPRARRLARGLRVREQREQLEGSRGQRLGAPGWLEPGRAGGGRRRQDHLGDVGDRARGHPACLLPHPQVDAPVLPGDVPGDDLKGLRARDVLACRLTQDIGPLQQS